MLDTMQAALYTWMKRETKLANVIFPRQGKPRPKPPYGTILVVPATARVGAFDELRAEGDTFTLVGLRTVLVSINIFGEGANAMMAALRNSLDKPRVIDEFAAAEIAHLDESGPNDLTSLEETIYRERSQMDLTLGLSEATDAEVTALEDTDIESLALAGE